MDTKEPFITGNDKDGYNVFSWHTSTGWMGKAGMGYYDKVLSGGSKRDAERQLQIEKDRPTYRTKVKTEIENANI